MDFHSVSHLSLILLSPCLTFLFPYFHRHSCLNHYLLVFSILLSHHICSTLTLLFDSPFCPHDTFLASRYSVFEIQHYRKCDGQEKNGQSVQSVISFVWDFIFHKQMASGAWIMAKDFFLFCNQRKSFYLDDPIPCFENKKKMFHLETSTRQRAIVIWKIGFIASIFAKILF